MAFGEAYHWPPDVVQGLTAGNVRRLMAAAERVDRRREEQRKNAKRIPVRDWEIEGEVLTDGT